MRSLAALAELLTTRVDQTGALGEAVSLKPLLAELARQAGGVSAATIPENAQRDALAAFWERKSIDTFRDARLVAFGLAIPAAPHGVCVFEDTEYFDCALRDIGKWYANPSLFRRCYQGLLASYFAYDAEPSSTGMKNWADLRDFLGARTSALSNSEFCPEWVQSLREHPELFTPSPCARLGQVELDGHESYVNELKSRLLIGDSSWFSRELFFGKVRAACALPDDAFFALVPELLVIVSQNELYQDQGLGFVLDRYARSESPPMNIALRDHTVARWGNPWLSQNAVRWGYVSEGARGLLGEWLKLEFIESFFTLLAEDGQSDRRRMNFWKRYVNQIDDIRFALGSDAHYSHKRDFVELKRKAQGLTVPLSDGSPMNNAFIMTMKGHVMVEFSGTANATYIYRSDSELPFDTRRPVYSAKNGTNSLKSDKFKIKLTHQDGILGFVRWEDRFASDLAARCGIVSTRARTTASTSPTNVNRPRTTAYSDPSATVSQGLARTAERATHPYSPQARDWLQVEFSAVALADFCRHFELTIDDKRSKGGLLWIRDSPPASSVTAVLSRWGFKFRTEKGWWRL